jgi:Fe-S cluster assembly protein SufD
MDKLIIKQITDKLKNDYFEVIHDQKIKIFLIFMQTVDYSLELKLNGEKAQADIYCIVIGDKDTQINIETVQLHQAPNTRSNLLVKSVLSGHAIFNFTGLIKVEKIAQITDAYQKNANLLISENAKTETKPVLEILANDVKCTHGVTIGNIDQDQLFYLENRGISELNAKRLLIKGFFQEIIDKISDQPIINQLEKKINELGFEY